VVYFLSAPVVYFYSALDTSDEQILLIEGKPIRCKQARYYDDKAFVGIPMNR